MRILLIGAGGMIGSRIAAEARERGHEVTGATRGGAGGTRIVDAADAPAVAALAAGHDAVVLAIAPPRDGSEPSGPLLAAGRGVLEGMRAAGVRRLVIVGERAAWRRPRACGSSTPPVPRSLQGRGPVPGRAAGLRPRAGR
nr:hypothetical protein GCM10020093_093720 [Planobispora longispora]